MKKKNIKAMYYAQKYNPSLVHINGLEPDLSPLSDSELLIRIGSIKAQAIGDDKTTDELLEEVYALVRETAKRILGLRAFDVQILGAVALNDGKIAEMATGEGKTLVGIFPVILNALTHKGVHVVSPNNYLSERDWKTLQPLLDFWGITSGAVLTTMSRDEKREAYAKDVTYCENTSLVFDYLHDNLVFSPEEHVQRGFNYAIIDEIDAVLLDAAKSPFVISGQGSDVNSMILIAKDAIEDLAEEDIHVQKDVMMVTLSSMGEEKMEKRFGINNIYEMENQSLLHYLTNALRAKFIFSKDVDYIVQDGSVILVNENTGRLSIGTRYQNELHQAIEAKEGVTIIPEMQVLSSITYQNFFESYNKICGMTGTAMTNEQEFNSVYGLDVVEIPRNRDLKRIDKSDILYTEESKKIEGVLDLIRERHDLGQPILVGCSSIEKSELYSESLKKAGIEHRLLNVNSIADESEIISHAGELGQITVATNMAGRGTDIKVTPEAIAVGGLLVIGTERNTSRRVDNQLRGRCGRQGDVGESIFFVSLDDELMCDYALDSFKFVIETLGITIGNGKGIIQNEYVTKYVARTQLIVEGNDFESRQQEIMFSRITNEWWKAFSQLRESIVDSGENFELALDNLLKFGNELTEALGIKEKQDSLKRETLAVFDKHWRAFLFEIDEIQFSTTFSSYAGKSPVQEYLAESGKVFDDMKKSITEEIRGLVNGKNK